MMTYKTRLLILAFVTVLQACATQSPNIPVSKTSDAQKKAIREAYVNCIRVNAEQLDDGISPANDIRLPPWIRTAPPLTRVLGRIAAENDRIGEGVTEHIQDAHGMDDT